MDPRRRDPRKRPDLDRFSFSQIVRAKFQYYLKQMNLFWLRNRNQIPLFSFVAFSCLIAYYMESQNDEIKRRIQAVNSIDTEVKEKESDLLKKLAVDPENLNLNKQIREIQQSKMYLYEQIEKETED